MNLAVYIPALVLALALGAFGQKLGIGPCPATSVIEGFDPVRYLGKWYEIKSYPAFFQNGVCTEANYGPFDDGNRISVINKQLDRGGVVRGVQGFAEQPRPGGGDLKVTLRVPVRGNTQSGYNVLGTDYQSWALVHSCVGILGVKAEFAWVLSRTRQLSFDDQQEVDQLIARNNLDLSAFRQTRQDGCPDFDTMPVSFIA